MMEKIVFTGLVLSLILSARLIFDRSVSRNRFLFIIFILISIELFYGWIYLSRTILDYPHLMRLNTPFVLLIAPAIYLLVRQTWQQGHPRRIPPLWHLLPFIVCVLYFLPFYFSPHTAKSQYMLSMYDSLGMDSWIWGGIRRLQQLVYLVLTFFIIYQNRRHVSFKRDKMVFFILIPFSLLWMLDMYRYLFTFDLITGVINVIILAGLMMTLVYFSLFPEKRRSGQRYKKSSLPMEKRQHIKKMILQLLESEKLYTIPHLKLIHLSEKLNVPLHDISQTINREFDVNFNEMVNIYRAREARKLIAEKKHDHLTMEAIGNMAGFGSTTSFNNYFRKYFNEKPSDIRNRISPGEK